MGATEVLVVGAGPAGLTMWRTSSTGRASVTGSSRRRPVEESRALVVHAKTLELLARLDLADRAVDEDQRMGAVALFSESKPVGRSSFLDDGADDRTPYPFALVLEQIKTERVLIGGLEEAGGWVEWETELVSLTSTPDGVRASVRRRIVPRSLSRPGRSSARTRRAVL